MPTYNTFIGTVEVPSPLPDSANDVTFIFKSEIKQHLSRISTNAPYDLKLLENAMAAAGYLYAKYETFREEIRKNFRGEIREPHTDFYAYLVHQCAMLVHIEVCPPIQESLSDLRVRHRIRYAEQRLLGQLLEACIDTRTLEILRHADVSDRVQDAVARDCPPRSLWFATLFSDSLSFYTRVPKDTRLWSKITAGKAKVEQENTIVDRRSPVVELSCQGGLARSRAALDLYWLACHTADKDFYLRKEALLPVRSRNAVRSFIGDPELPVGNDLSVWATLRLRPSLATQELSKEVYIQQHYLNEWGSSCRDRFPLSTKALAILTGNPTTLRVAYQPELCEPSSFMDYLDKYTIRRATSRAYPTSRHLGEAPPEIIQRWRVLMELRGTWNRG